MTKQTKLKESRIDEKNQNKTVTQVADVLSTDLASLVQSPDTLLNIPSRGSVEAQAAQLGAPRMHTVQRQTLATQIGQLHGNQHLQRMVASLKNDKSQSVQRRDDDKDNRLLERIQVASGSGSRLDTNIQQHLEDGLGADLSNVRVHTDGEADSLAHSVHAVAFTTGQDIFFRAGTYNPNSLEGMHLLAHEATHTVQQATGSVAGIPSPEGISISDPSDKFEQAANKAADSIIASSQAETAMDGTTSEQGNSAGLTPVSSPMIQRKAEIIHPVGWGRALFGDASNVWFNPHAELLIGDKVVGTSWFAGGANTSFAIPSGTTSGMVNLYIDMGWFRDMPLFDESGSASYLLQVRFTVSHEGNLTLQGPIGASNSQGEGAQLISPVPVLTTGNSIVASPTINGMGTLTSGVTNNVNVGMSGEGASVGASGGVSVSQSTPRGSIWTRSFIVDLIPPAAPKSKTESYQTSPYFAVGSDRLEEGSQAFIAEWYMGLPNDVKQAVQSGSTQIVLRGYASTTQGGEANQALSAKRAARVQTILQGLAGSNAKFQVFALGEYTANTGDNVEDYNERRVEIEVSINREESASTPTPNPSGP